MTHKPQFYPPIKNLRDTNPILGKFHVVLDFEVFSSMMKVFNKRNWKSCLNDCQKKAIDDEDELIQRAVHNRDIIIFNP